MTINVKEAAHRIGVSESRVRHLIMEGRLLAVRHGLRELSIDEDSVANFERKPLGRPLGAKNKSKIVVA